MGLLFDNERITEVDWLNRGIHENACSPAVLSNIGWGRADNNCWIGKDLGGGSPFLSPRCRSRVRSRYMQQLVSRFCNETFWIEHKL